MALSSTSTALLAGLALAGAGLLLAGARKSRLRKPSDRQEVTEAGRDVEHVPHDEAAGAPQTPSSPRTGASSDRRLRAFFALSFFLAIPFWLFGGGKLPLPINLPVGALVTFVPMTAAALVAYRYEGRAGARPLFQRALDYRRIKDGRWYLPALLLMPAIYAASYVVMRLLGRPLPEQVELSMPAALAFIAIFFIGDIGEELGWTALATDPLQRRWGALRAGLLLGLVWDAWQIVPWIQTGNSALWIAWQALYSIALRILIVWVYNGSGRSVFAAILVHVASNVSWSLFPNYGTHYDPSVTALVAWVAVALVLLWWEPATLARLRQARARGS
jgi:uncharacterized protein